MRSLFLVIAVAFSLFTVSAEAKETRAAVASNFLSTFRLLASDFAQNTQHQIVIISGSSGKLFAQIQHGAPFDVFFSADQERPRHLEDTGLGVQKSRFPYALGYLTLWSPHINLIGKDGTTSLSTQPFTHLAIANPKTAPYGRAAEQTLRSLDLWERLKPRLVYGENIAQTHHFVSSGNAELGFLALAQVRSSNALNKDNRWDVPSTLHDPIVQEAILLNHGASNTTALAFLQYLKSPAAKKIIMQRGYGIPDSQQQKKP